MDKILQEILQIDSSRECINFLVKQDRMGLIDRFNAKKKQLNPFDNGTKNTLLLQNLA